MKCFLSILLALAVLSQTMINVGIEVYYQLNKQYISQQLCINKNQPQLHCNGHCYLVKQLKAVEHRERQSQSGILKGANEIMTEGPAFAFTAYVPVFENLGRIFSYQDISLSPPVFTIYQPPKFS